ncbi:transposase family protein [Sporosarcina globispora]|uniref:transposase family protein n=1 Tax=Sporosarcina globispora TaxID=1459 RepID=UPI003BF5CFC2
MCELMMVLWLSPDSHLELIHVSSSSDSDSLLLTVQSTRSSASCPKCKKITSRIHSRYVRNIQDLLISGQPVELQKNTPFSTSWTAQGCVFSLEIMILKNSFKTMLNVQDKFHVEYHFFANSIELRKAVPLITLISNSMKSKEVCS